MKEKTNISKLKSIFKSNGGYITREDIDNAGISSWFLSDFVRKNRIAFSPIPQDLSILFRIILNFYSV